MIDWQSIFCWHRYETVAKGKHEYFERDGTVVYLKPLYLLQCKKCGRMRSYEL